MKQDFIKDVIQGMLPYLNNAQNEKLQEVLKYTLAKYEVTENQNKEKYSELNFVELFLSAKRIEGCSEKSLKYYNQSTYSPKENWQFVNYLDTGNITMNKIDEIQYINTAKDKLPSRAKRKVKTNSIIYSTVRPNQLHYGIIKEQPDNFLVSTGFTVIEVNYDKAVPDFIYYALTKQEVTEQLQAIAEQSVSAYPSLKPSDIENLEFMLPDKKTQERIVAILRSIDEKIKENNAINNNLEQQAEAIFQSILSNAITTVNLGEIADVKGGKRLPKGVNLIDIPNARRTCFYCFCCTDER